MHSDAPDERPRHRIGELARATGVSRETIHFYLREGLLQPPEKVNARVSYFGDAHVARLRLIKAFQQAHIPLARIREQLEGLSRMGTPETPATVERAVAVATEFLSVDGEELALSVAEVAAEAGLAVEVIERLEALGVLRPQVADGDRMYTAAEVEAAKAARTIMDQGVDLEKLRFVRRYTELAEQELAYLLNHLIRPALAAGRRDQVSATLANRGLRVIEAYLRRQYRRETILFPPEIPDLPDPLAEQPKDDTTPREDGHGDDGGNH